MVSFVSDSVVLHAHSPSRITAFTIKAVQMAAETPTKSRLSSVRMRARRRIVAQRSSKESAGGRLRRMSTGGSAGGSGVVTGGSSGGRMRAGASGTMRSGADNAPASHMLCALSQHGVQREAGMGPTAGHAVRLGGAGPGQGLDAGLLERAAQALAQLDLRLPPEDLARQRDVGLADLGVVHGGRLVHDLRPRAGDLDNRLRELQQRELVGIADVDRMVVARLGEADDPVDEVGDVTERPRLRAVPE